MFKESCAEGILPPSLRRAMITSILKPCDPPTECSSFRPISLMGCDTEILSKAKRLEKYLPHLVCNAQNGFVKKRDTDFIKLGLSWTYCMKNITLAAVLFWHARHAFYRIERDYLFNLLSRFGISVKFLRWIQLLYQNPNPNPNPLYDVDECFRTKIKVYRTL